LTLLLVDLKQLLSSCSVTLHGGDDSNWFISTNSIAVMLCILCHSLAVHMMTATLPRSSFLL